MFGSPEAQKCTNSKGELVDYKLSVNLYCDKVDNSIGFTSLKVSSDDACAPVITGTHSNACPVFSVTKFASFFVRRP